jgi:hypothetical protein
MLGAYPGVTSPYGLPQTLQTSGIHPAAVHPLAALAGLSPLFQGGFSPFGQQGYPGIGYGGLNPQQQFGQTQNPFLQHTLPGIGMQNPWATAGLQNPLIHSVLQNPLLQNPLLQSPVTNPIQAQIHAQLIAQQVAQQLAAQQLAAQHLAQQLGFQPYGMHPQGLASPFGQTGQWGQGPSQLAPQSWVGQGGQFGGGIGYGQGSQFGIGYGQGHPFSQYGRGIQTGGISPWTGF